MFSTPLLRSFFALCLPPRIAPSPGNSNADQKPTTDAASHVNEDSKCVFHVDNGPSVIARASIVSTDTSGTKCSDGLAGPRIVCKLSKPSSKGGRDISSTASSMTICMPAHVQWDSEARRKQFDAGWLQLEAVAADDGALAAFHSKDLGALAVALKAMVQQDASLSATLSLVAFSVAAPVGAACSGASSSSLCCLTGSGALKGCSLMVSGAYMRDPEDGTLYPSLALELRNLGSGEDWLQDVDDDPAPRAQQPELKRNTAADIVAHMSRRKQRNLLRASTMLSAAPNISTLLELDLADISKRPSPCNLPVRRGESSEQPSIAPEAASGRVLLQNEGSLDYWGKLTSRNQTGSWQLLVELLQDKPNALEDLLEHLKVNRIKQGSDQGVTGRPWKQVVCVPSHYRSFAKTLRDQVQPKDLSKDTKMALASWLTGGSSNVAGLTTPSPPPSAPVTRFQTISAPASSSLATTKSASQLLDQNVFTVAPSRQVMSLMAAVSGPASKQTSVNRRMGHSSSAAVRHGDASVRAGERYGEGTSATSLLQPTRSASATMLQKLRPLVPTPLDAISPMSDESDSGEEDAATNLQAIQEEEESEEMLRYHEIQVIPVRDQLTGKETLLLIQTDITSRALMEMRIAALTESQLRMLEGMFPRHVLEFVMGASGSLEDLGSVAHQHREVTILFMDVVGFTSMSKEVAPKKVMEFLNTLFRKFDDLCDTYHVYKVETAGDCYIVAGSLMTRDEDGFVTLDLEPDGCRGASNVLNFGQAMLRHARTVTMPHNGQPTSVRIGIHTGSVTSGLIGTKLPKFGLFGDTMNTSSRMESTGRPGCIQISEAMLSFLAEEDRALFEPSGGIEVKGKGLMPTFIWTPKDEDLALRPTDVGATSRVSRKSMGGSESAGVDVSVSVSVSRRQSARQSMNGLLERCRSNVSPNAESSSQWSLVRNALKASTNQDNQEKENKRDLIRSRLSRIARGAKSSPMLVVLEQNHPGLVSKQGSMYMMQEMLQLMKATVDE